ncbi:aldehyde-activating protein [Tamilnaduibacter salinus]|uniref:Aldehyde-activating protein n=1 Tax=Tamilnaduibacter salinus TaxID=1484056 RepID=A0A2A2I7W9_9GAMM|nr:GFA family protein [Tamilnaduibacter salinus]PAV27143.1 aldehyde-activating protein [Tamilnaduibacter salinus]
MMTGQCLCGGVAFEVSARPGPVALCHCSQCRRASGSAFMATCPVQSAYFSYQRGESLVREFASSPGKYRAFCSECGSPLYSRTDAIPGILRLRVGALDHPFGQPPAYHVFTGSMADWDRITDDLPQYEKLERTNDPH